MYAAPARMLSRGSWESAPKSYRAHQSDHVPEAPAPASAWERRSADSRSDRERSRAARAVGHELDDGKPPNGLKEVMAVNMRRKRHYLQMTQEARGLKRPLRWRYRTRRCVGKRHSASKDCRGIRRETGRLAQASWAGGANRRPLQASRKRPADERGAALGPAQSPFGLRLRDQIKVQVSPSSSSKRFA
jgi:hypothetical protein